MKCSRALTTWGGNSRAFRAALIALLLCALTPSEMRAQAQESSPAIALLNHAVVNTATIALSDLLPKSAGEKEREIAKKISLGIAPLPGSLRVYNAEQIERAIAGRLPVSLASQVTIWGGGWPVNRDEIRAALRARNMENLSEAPISIPSEILTRNQNAELELVSVGPGWDASTSIVRLRCTDRAGCGAFDVLLNLSVALGSSRQEQQASTRAQTPLLVRPGRKARLLILSDGVRITLPVRPLGAGRLGKTVRVLDPGSHRVLVARVNGKDSLESDLKSKPLESK